MSNSVPTNFIPAASRGVRQRRALIIAESSGIRLQQQLTASGYQTQLAKSADALNVIKEFSPHLVMIELRRSGGHSNDNDCLSLARRLRAESATYALPLVFVFDEDESAMRNAALNIGADDYFGLWTPVVEMLARLDALLWRAEAGRRAASTIGDQRLEIDNFMLLLDSVREDVQAGKKGTLALVYALSRSGDGGPDKFARDRSLAEAQGFLKLNLRRLDAVAFYGPTALLVYLPRTEGESAQAALSKLRREFIAEREGDDIAIGLTSFPADGSEVEALIEKAEAAVEEARDNSTAERVIVYQAKEKADQNKREETEIFHTAGPPMPATDAVEIIAERPTLTFSFEAQVARALKPVEVLEKASIHTSPGKDVRQGNGGARAHGMTASRATAEAVAHERELRASGVLMPHRLLLTVSDTARMAQLNALVRSAGYEARTAFDGEQAMDLLHIERPDLLLLDYELSGIDGIEILRRLRRRGGGQLTPPVILLLPAEHERERLEALELGARGIVSMPYDPAELLSSVRLAGNAG